MARPGPFCALLPFLFCCVFTPAVLCADSEAVLNGEVGRLNNETLLWGPYRPNLYFGVRPRMAESLMAGLMWAKVDNYMDVQHSTLLFFSRRRAT